MSYRRITSSAIGLIAFASAASAQGTDLQNFGIEAGVSTLGFFLAPDMEVAPNFHLRAPVYFGAYSGDIDFEGNTGNGEADVFSFHLMGDYYLFNSGFRLSGGVSFGGYNVSATFPGSITLDGTTYNATITGNLEQDQQIAPVLAIGYNHTFQNNWGLVAEIGARITTLDLTTTGQDALLPADRDQFNREIADINDTLDSVGVTPFLSLGLSYKF